MAKRKFDPSDWDNLEDDKLESDNETEETPEETEKKKDEAVRFAERNRLKIEQIEQIRKLKEEYIEKYPDHDIVAFAVRGITRDRWYIVRSLDIGDMDLVTQHIRKVGKQILKENEERKERIDRERAKVSQKGEMPDHDLIRKLTEEIEEAPAEIDKAQDYKMMELGTLYPPDFGEKYQAGKCRPGDISHVLQAIIGLSGFFPPVMDNDAEQLMEGELFELPEDVVMDDE